MSTRSVNKVVDFSGTVVGSTCSVFILRRWILLVLGPGCGRCSATCRGGSKLEHLVQRENEQMVSIVIFFIISFPGPTRTQNERRQFSIIQLILALPHHYLFAFAMCEVHVVSGSYAHVLFGYDFVVPSEGNATVVPRSVLALCAHPHQGYLLLYTFFLFAHVLRPLFLVFQLYLFFSLSPPSIPFLTLPTVQ